ncbi:hypothetical protein [Ornithinibacillus bavariensis]|uniref:hypothetical protein n=1 Tax=Ornithinibacillus bavariensis TaxID=545502 RepID=UPI003D22D2F2
MLKETLTAPTIYTTLLNSAEIDGFLLKLHMIPITSNICQDCQNGYELSGTSNFQNYR